MQHVRPCIQHIQHKSLFASAIYYYIVSFLELAVTYKKAHNICHILVIYQYLLSYHTLIIYLDYLLISSYVMS